MGTYGYRLANGTVLERHVGPLTPEEAWMLAARGAYLLHRAVVFWEEGIDSTTCVVTPADYRAAISVGAPPLPAQEPSLLWGVMGWLLLCAVTFVLLTVLVGR